MYDASLAEILTCDDAELPKIRQALVIADGLKNLISGTITSLEGEGVDLDIAP